MFSKDSAQGTVSPASTIEKDIRENPVRRLGVTRKSAVEAFRVDPLYNIPGIRKNIGDSVGGDYPLWIKSISMIASHNADQASF